MTKEEMEKKIDSLEKKIKELESRPSIIQNHYHYSIPTPTYYPWPYYQPVVYGFYAGLGQQSTSTQVGYSSTWKVEDSPT